LIDVGNDNLTCPLDFGNCCCEETDCAGTEDKYSGFRWEICTPNCVYCYTKRLEDGADIERDIGWESESVL